MFKNQAPPRFANPPKPPKVVKKQHENIEAIFFKSYRILIAARYVRSIEEQRMQGDLGTGDRRMDEVLGDTKMPVYVTINDMVEYFREGIDFVLTGENDSKSIYEAIVAHTGTWRKQLRHVMNVGNAPLEDLILMEQFAAKFYAYAKFEYEKRPKFEAATGTLAAFLYSGSVVRGSTIVDGQIASSNIDRDNVDVKTLTHEPNIDIFRQALVDNMGLAMHGQRN